jgi:hypothetical protein
MHDGLLMPGVQVVASLSPEIAGTLIRESDPADALDMFDAVFDRRDQTELTRRVRA